VKPLCDFESTPTAGGWFHRCRVCGFTKASPSRRYVRQCRGQQRDPTEPPRGPCVHRGESTDELVECQSCVKASLKVFECAVHGKCTIEKKGAGVSAVCRTCKDYQSVTLGVAGPSGTAPTPS